MDNQFINVKTGKVQKLHPDFVNDKTWLANHNLVKQTQPKPAQVTNLIPESEKEIIDYEETAESNEPAPVKKSNSKTK